MNITYDNLSVIRLTQNSQQGYAIQKDCCMIFTA